MVLGGVYMLEKLCGDQWGRKSLIFSSSSFCFFSFSSFFFSSFSLSSSSSSSSTAVTALNNCQRSPFFSSFNRITPKCTSLQQNHTKLCCQAYWGGPFQSRIEDEVELNCWASASLECWRIALELLPTPNNWRWMRAGNWYFIQTSSNTRQLSS